MVFPQAPTSDTDSTNDLDPAADTGEMPEGMEEPEPGLTLTPEQIGAAGLDGLMEGDTFTVTITGTVVSADGQLQADITEASNGQMQQAELGEPATMAPASNPKPPGVQSPSQAGFGNLGKREDY